MSFVDKFLAHYSNHNDFSKASRFEATIYPNNFLATRFPDITNLRIQCEAAELPGYSFDTVEGRVYGASYAVAARPQFSDLRLTFICTGDLWEKRIFDTWQEFIMPKSDFFPRYHEEYVTTIQVVQYLETTSQNIANQDPSGSVANKNAKPNVAYGVLFYEAFPTTVEPITLSWADDAVNRLSVSFKYRRWASF